MAEGQRSGDDQSATDQTPGRRLSVTEAAEALGISGDAVRSRIKRGTLATVREGGRVFVVLGATDRPSAHVQPTHRPSKRDELVDELRDRIRSLERRLDEEGESRRRSDTIIAQLTQANTALTERLRELEAASDEPEAREGREASAEEPAEGAPGVQAGQADTGAPVASLKASGLTVSEGVAIGVITAAILAAAKVIVPLVVGLFAFIVAGVTAVNGQYVSTVVSVVVSVITLIQGGIYWRRSRQALPFEYHFAEASWTEGEDEDPKFTLEIPKSEHGKGDSPTANVYWTTAEGGYEEVITSSETRPSGSLLIGASSRFAGKVVIR